MSKDQIIEEFAKKVSKVEHVLKAHVVSCKTGRHHIIFEFEHLVDHEKEPRDLWKKLLKERIDDLLKELLELSVEDKAGKIHRVVADSVDFCVIQSSYQCGKLIH